MIRCRNCWVRSFFGAVKICVGRALLEDHAGVEEADAVGDLAGEGHLVRRDQHRHPALGELADHLEHLADELRVEGARDLVEEHQLRVHRERPHDRDALLLAAREPVGVLVALVGERRSGRAARRRCASASRRSRPSTVCGASVTFRSTDMCGKRLYDWKTIPIRRRTLFWSTPGAAMSTPSSTIRPASIGSIRFTQRSSVDLPRPGRRRSGTRPRAQRHVEVDPAAAPRSRRTTCARPRARAPAHRIPADCQRCLSRAASQSVKRASGIVIATKSSAATRYGV